MPSTDYITFGGVGISESALWQSEKKRKALEIKRTGVTACELHYGSPEERPLVSIILGIVLMGPGAWLLGVYLLGQVHVGLRNIRYDSAMLLFFGLGLWLIYQAIGRRAYYLRIGQSGISRKLVFDTKEASGIYTFLEDAKARFGFTYENRCPPDLSPNNISSASK
jgi:hypothetical protein